MGKPLHRLGDPNTAGAPVIRTKVKNVISGGRTIATTGDSVKNHDVICPHPCGPRTGPGSPTVLSKGTPVNRKGDPDTCGHPRAIGNVTVYIGP